MIIYIYMLHLYQLYKYWSPSNYTKRPCKWLCPEAPIFSTPVRGPFRCTWKSCCWGTQQSGHIKAFHGSGFLHRFPILRHQHGAGARDIGTRMGSFCRFRATSNTANEDAHIGKPSRMSFNLFCLLDLKSGLFDHQIYSKLFGLLRWE